MFGNQTSDVNYVFPKPPRSHICHCKSEAVNLHWHEGFVAQLNLASPAGICPILAGWVFCYELNFISLLNVKAQSLHVHLSLLSTWSKF